MLLIFRRTLVHLIALACALGALSAAALDLATEAGQLTAYMKVRGDSKGGETIADWRVTVREWPHAELVALRSGRHRLILSCAARAVVDALFGRALTDSTRTRILSANRIAYYVLESP